jgi:hypothetical protein
MPTPYRRYLLIASLLFITYYVFIRTPQISEDEQLVIVRVVSDESDEILDYDPDVLQKPVFQRQKDIIKQENKLEWLAQEEETPLSSEEEKVQPQFVRKIVAIGDLHGDLPNAMKVLRMTKVIDERGDWSGDVDFLVQTGDIIGTSSFSVKCSLSNVYY